MSMLFVTIWDSIFLFMRSALLGHHVGVTLTTPPSTMRLEFDALKRKYTDKQGLYRKNFAHS